MRRQRAFAWVALATALALPVAGCAGGRLSLSVQKMCESAMGKWSPASETCVPTPGLTERDAKQGNAICLENGGVYIPGGMCQYDLR